MKFFLLLLLVLQFTLTVSAESTNTLESEQLKRWGLQDIYTDSLNQKTERLLKVWDSLYPQQKSIVFNLLTELQWRNIFEAQYKSAIRTGKKDLQFKLALPLATVYHVTSEFSKGLPLLQYLHVNKQKLSRQNLGIVLIKLEEVYRSINNISQAFLIRGERVEAGFISTYWELYKECGLWEEALNDFRLFEKIPGEIGVRRMKYYGFFADIFFKARQYDSAEFYYRKGFDEAIRFVEKNKITKEVREDNAEFWKGYFSGFIGSCYTARGEYLKAIPLLVYDLSLCKGRYRIGSLLLLSDCYLQQGKLLQCKSINDTLHSYLQGRQMKDQNIYFFKLLADYHKTVKHFDSATFYLQKYISLKELLNEQIINNQSVFLLTKLEAQKRRTELLHSQSALDEAKLQGKLQKQQLLLLLFFLLAAIIILLLVYRNSRQLSISKNEIETQNIALVKNARVIALQNERSEILLSELHHRVKNNLQLIYSMLNLQSRRSVSIDTKQQLAAVQSRLQSISLVHENLCSSSNFESVELDSYLHSLVANLQKIYHNDESSVTIKYDLEPLQISLDKAISLGLIVNEIVSNAFKYAFRPFIPGFLNFTVRLDEGNCVIEISDNGPGFLFINSESTSLGIKLVKSMCKQLNAAHLIDHSVGVKHSVVFKL